MIKKIIELAIEKAKKNTTGKKDTSYFTEIAKSLKSKLSYKTIERIYKKYILGEETEWEPTGSTINLLCEYIEYKDYQEFVKKNKEEDINNANNDTIEKENIEKKGNTINNNNNIHINEPTEHNNLTKIVIVLGIVALLIFIITAILKLNNPDTTNVEKLPMIINNFNGDSNYYYYLNDIGKTELTKEPNKYENAKPLTLQVFNTYLQEKGLDTTIQKVKLIKAQYFDDKWKDVEQVKLLKEEIIQPKKKQNEVTRKKINLRKEDTQLIKKTVSKTLRFNIVNNDVEDKDILEKFTTKYAKNYNVTYNNDATFICKGNTSYIFRDSKMTEGRIICDLTLHYKIINQKTKAIVESNKVSVAGTGFSKESAKNNTIAKLKI